MTIGQIQIGDRITYDFTQHTREVVKVWRDGDSDGFVRITAKNPDGSMYESSHNTSLMPGNISMVSRDGNVIYCKEGK